MKPWAMLYLILVALLSLVLSASAADTLEVPEKNQTILRTGEWLPSAEQAQRALSRVQAFLQNPNLADQERKAEVAEIIGNKAGYRVQFVGALRAGKKVIVCNFFPTQNAAGKDSFPKWQNQQVVADDGGTDFWRIEYDPATDACTHFECNGVA